MSAELNVTEREAPRPRRGHQGPHLQVTILLVCVSLMLLWVASCGRGGPSEEHCLADRAADTARYVGTVIRPRQPQAKSASRTVTAPESSLRLTLPDGGVLTVSAPTDLPGRDAAFAAFVVGDYLTALARRASLPQ